jgi:kynurenine formamidase
VEGLQDLRAGELLEVLRHARWVDLSVLVSNEHPSYPYGMAFRRTPWANYSTQWPYHSNMWVLDEHTGTHFDAPVHFVPPPDSGLPNAGPAGATTSEKVPLDQFRGPARIIDVRDRLHQAPNGASPMVPPQALLAHEDLYGPVHAGDVVVLWTGWDRFWQRGSAGKGYFVDVYADRTPGWTSPSVEFTELLVERGVRALATDAASIGSVDDGARTHLAGLRHGMTFVEGLTNLEQVPAVGAYFLFLPVRVEGGSGGPGRAVALIPPSAGTAGDAE